MTKTEAVDFYHSLMRFGVMPGLDRISILLERLGNPQDKLKCIHVAGTNGKGSTCTELSGVLTAAGYKTGLYTSPFVIDFSERIQINGKMISDSDLVDCTERVSEIISALAEEKINITEFEAITAAAFLYFNNQKCDFVVLETGLGGRFDATNVIKENICSIITSVSLDHTGVLGDTIGKIAFEKSGIIKSHCPVITGSSQSEEALEVIVNAANSSESPLFIADENKLVTLNENITGNVIEADELTVQLPFPGEHQKKNTALVLAAIEIIRNLGYNINSEAICSGIENAFIPARVEIISKKPLVILDGCHNPDSTQALASLIDRFLKNKKVLGLTAMMKDKDCEQNFSNLCSLFDTVICTEASNPRSAKADYLKDLLSKQVNTYCLPDREDALKYASAVLDNYDCLIVFGSLYFASDVRNQLINEYKK